MPLDLVSEGSHKWLAKYNNIVVDKAGGREQGSQHVVTGILRSMKKIPVNVLALGAINRKDKNPNILHLDVLIKGEFWAHNNIWQIWVLGGPGESVKVSCSTLRMLLSQMLMTK